MTFAGNMAQGVNVINPNRELGVMFAKGDRVRIYHGILNARTLRDNPRNGIPPSMEQDCSVGLFGVVVSVQDRNNNRHEKVYSGNGYEDFLSVEIKFDYPNIKIGTVVTDECIEHLEMDCLVNYSLLGDEIANNLYEKSRDKNLPQYESFHEEIIDQEILEVTDSAIISSLYEKYNIWQIQLYAFYFELLEDLIKIKKMYIRDVHKWHAENLSTNSQM